MGRYINKLKTENIGGGKHRVIEDFIYYSNTVGYIIVPAGFETNFASVPRLPFVYLLFGGVGDEEAVLHDFLYTPPHTPGTCHQKIVTRSEADLMFRGARYQADYCALLDYEDVRPMRILGNAWAYIGSWCMWAGVRLFGWRHWKA